MYNRSAIYYDEMYHFKDYGAAANKLHGLIRQFAPHAKTLLDVACGTGRHLEHLRLHYAVEGLDVNPDLLAAARRRNPGVPLHQGDMTNFDLAHTFDVVTCLFSAVAYGKTTDNLCRTIESLAHHVSDQGVVFVEPFFSPSQFRVDDLVLNTVDGEGTKLAWMYKTTRHGSVGTLDIHHLVGTNAGIEHFVERHELGLFEDYEYLGAFARVGMTVEWDREGLFGRGLYIARRASTAQEPGTP